MKDLLTLKQIWDKFSHPRFSFLIAKDREGNLTRIEGYREEDPTGGCQATGTPGCIYGSSANSGEPWWNYPKPKDADLAEWCFVRGYGEEFYVRNFEDGLMFRGIEETDQYFIVRKGRSRLFYSKNNNEKVSSESICACCLQNLNKDVTKFSFFSWLFGY
jgi:hypothetical protein